MDAAQGPPGRARGAAVAAGAATSWHCNAAQPELEAPTPAPACYCEGAVA